MNFLGHWLFSDPTPDALIGSLWPDFARRPDPNTVSEEFLIHFDRHQWLDRLTDTTPLLEPLRASLRPRMRKTTPVVIDMLIDHHLAKYWNSYHPEPLERFCQLRYKQAQKFTDATLPERMEKVLYWMTEDNWLAGYRSADNISKAFRGLSKRIRLADEMELHAYWSIEQVENEKAAVETFIIETLSSLRPID